ncbi:amino acid ABC transporter permease [Streptomyces sp. NPDC046385]|uniref:amino acid ABC transporter permease n=1 Tax=Streptomyces sp. NPDC046385 TaxID=3154918 RepID=UPI00340FDA12
MKGTRDGTGEAKGKRKREGKTPEKEKGKAKAPKESGAVLYDVPGPRARRRNLLLTLLFLLAVGGVVWWVVASLADKDQLAWAKWAPFFTDPRVWHTYLLPALKNTVTAAALAMGIALPLGAFLGVARLSDHRWVRGTAGPVVEFFRAIPVLILMLFANAAYAEFTGISPESRPLYAVVTGLVLYNASVLAEVVRAGILALPAGQTDAAKAIGMRKGQTMAYVLLPQSVTAMLPALVSQLVVIVKDTALGGAMLGFSELLASVRPMSANYGANTIASFTVVAVVFVVLNFALTSFASWLERRLRRGKRSTGAVVGADAVEDLAAPGEPGRTGPF